MTKNLFIAATGKDVGKSTISFALLKYLQNQNMKIGYMKPVGQRWKKSKWGKVEEDVILIKERFGLKESPSLMNPIVVKKGFTEKYLYKKIKPNLTKSILAGYKEISKDKDYVIIEGTGHAGVGSVFGHSNADVAKKLDSQVIIIANGGVGKTIDKLELSRLFFEKKGVKVIGVIINKVLPSKTEKIKKAIKKYCSIHKIKLLGIIPYSPILGNPTLGNIIDELSPQILNDTNQQGEVVDHFLVGASHVNEALNFLKAKEGKILMIIPSVRTDLAMAISNINEMKEFEKTQILALLFSGNHKPNQYSLKTLKNHNITTFWKKGDTFSVTSALSSISIKTRPLDNYKIEEINDSVINNLEIKSILRSLKTPKIKFTKLNKLKKIFNKFIGK